MCGHFLLLPCAMMVSQKHCRMCARKCSSSCWKGGNTDTGVSLSVAGTTPGRRIDACRAERCVLQVTSKPSPRYATRLSPENGLDAHRHPRYPIHCANGGPGLSLSLSLSFSLLPLTLLFSYSLSYSLPLSLSLSLSLLSLCSLSLSLSLIVIF